MTRPLLLAAALLLAGWCAASAAPSVSLKGQILLQADEMDYDVDNHVVSARGHVEIDGDGRILLADEVSYDQKNDTMTARGHVSITDEKGNFSMLLPPSTRGQTLRFWENQRQFFSTFPQVPGGKVDLRSWPIQLGDSASRGISKLVVPR